MLSGKDELFKSLVSTALLIRKVEERIIEVYPDDKVQSPVHLSIGQEAVAVGVCHALRREDWLYSSYRSHAFYLAKGGDLKAMFAELYGKVTGGAKGKAGSMHLTAPEVGLMGSSAVVASAIPHALGAAYASKIRNDGKVHLVAFGDGATEEGVYHESLNFAALHQLPIIFLCENNGLAVHSRPETRQRFSIRSHAATYQIPVHHVSDGNDIVAVFEAVSPLVERVRRGDGPQFIEIETCRYMEHVGPGEDFTAGYRSRSEIEPWMAKDVLIQNPGLCEKLLPDILSEIDEAAAFAEISPWPNRDELLTDVDHPDPQKTATPILSIPNDEEATRPVSYRTALFTTMREGMKNHQNTVIFGQGVDDHKGIFGTTTDLHNEFGSDRVFDTPLAEEAMAGAALGAALNGLYPIQTHIRSDFMLLCTNQIINLIAKYRYMFGGRFETPMLIRTVVGRSWGQGAQHSQSLQSLFAHIPGLTVIMPSSPQSILETYPYVIGTYRGPVISFEHRLLYDLEFNVDWLAVQKEQMPLMSRKIRDGKDVTIVATSIMVLEAQRAAKILAETAGIDCEIIDMHCVSHPDREMILDSVEKTGRLLVADTSWLPYGVSAEICRLVCERSPQALKAPVVTMGMAPAPCPTAKSLEDIYYPNLADLVDATAKLVTGKENHEIRLPDEKSMADVYKKFKGPF